MVKKVLTKADLTTEEIAFCAEYAKEGNASQAYIKAFNFQGDYLNDRKINSSLYNKTSRLLSKPHINAKIQEFKQLAVRRGNYSIGKLVEELDNLKALAVSDGKYGDAVRALELIGKTMSAFVERTENINTNTNTNIEISEEEEAQLDKDLQRLRELHEPTETKH